jgi:hypothetical protein
MTHLTEIQKHKVREAFKDMTCPSLDGICQVAGLTGYSVPPYQVLVRKLLMDEGFEHEDDFTNYASHPDSAPSIEEVASPTEEIPTSEREMLNKTKRQLESLPPTVSESLLNKVQLPAGNPHFLSPQMVLKAKEIHTNLLQGAVVGFQAPMMWGKTGTLIALAQMRAPDQFIYCPFVRDKEFLQDNEETFKRHGIDNVKCLSLHKLATNWDHVLKKLPNIKGFFFDECHYGTRKDSVADKVMSLVDRDISDPSLVFTSATPVQAILATLDKTEGSFDNFVRVHEEGGESYNGISDLRERCEIDHQPSVSFLEKNSSYTGQCVLEGEVDYHKQWSPSSTVRKHVNHLLAAPANALSIMAVRKANPNVSKSGIKVASTLNLSIQQEFDKEVTDGRLRVLTVCATKTGFKKIDDEFLLCNGHNDIKNKLAHAVADPFCRTLIIVVDGLKAGKNFGPNIKERVYSIIDAYKNISALLQGLPGRLCMHNRENWNILISCNIYSLECFEKLNKNPTSIADGKELLNLLQTENPDGTQLQQIATGVSARRKKRKNSIQEYHWLALPVCPTRYNPDGGSHINNYGTRSGINTFLRGLPYIQQLREAYGEGRRYCAAESPFGTQRDIFKAIINEDCYGGEVRCRNTFDSYFTDKSEDEIRRALARSIGIRNPKLKKDGKLEEIVNTNLSSFLDYNMKISDDRVYVQKILSSMQEGEFAENNLGIKTIQDVQDLHFAGRLCQVCISRPRRDSDPEEPVEGVIKSDPNIYNTPPS